MMIGMPLALRAPDPQAMIRPVRLADVAMLHTHCWPDRPVAVIHRLVWRAQENARLKRGLGVVSVGEDGTVRGFGQLTVWPRCAEISDLIVAPPHRNRGLGTALIQYLMRVACALHVECVEIGAALSNPGALALYRRLGFQDDRTVFINLGQGVEPVLYLRLWLDDKKVQPE